MSNEKLEVLTPDNCQLIFIDHQPQMAFGVQSIDRQTLKNNTVGLAKAAKVFNIPTTITTVETQAFSGHTYPELLDVFPDAPLLERTSMNSWDDQKVRDALAANNRKKVVVSGLWTEVCNCTFALSAMLEGDYEIYMVADASGVRGGLGSPWGSIAVVDRERPWAPSAGLTVVSPVGRAGVVERAWGASGWIGGRARVGRAALWARAGLQGSPSLREVSLSAPASARRRDRSRL